MAALFYGIYWGNENVSIEQTLSDLVNDQFDVSHFELINESHLHSGTNPETHFKLVLASGDFEGLSKVKRHQAVYGLTGELMAQGLHALALHLYTPEEWAETSQAPASPNCMGGSKHA